MNTPTTSRRVRVGITGALATAAIATFGLAAAPAGATDTTVPGAPASSVPGTGATTVAAPVGGPVDLGPLRAALDDLAAQANKDQITETKMVVDSMLPMTVSTHFEYDADTKRSRVVSKTEAANMTLPTMPEMPTLPQIPGLTMPTFPNMPELTIPGLTIPNITIPDFTIPGVTLPEMPSLNSETETIIDNAAGKAYVPVASVGTVSPGSNAKFALVDLASAGSNSELASAKSQQDMTAQVLKLKDVLSSANVAVTGKADDGGEQLTVYTLTITKEQLLAMNPLGPEAQQASAMLPAQIPLEMGVAGNKLRQMHLVLDVGLAKVDTTIKFLDASKGVTIDLPPADQVAGGAATTASTLAESTATTVVVSTTSA